MAEAHRARGVTLEGYSPFKAGDANDPVLAEIAEASRRRRRTRWCCAGTSSTSIVVIPKSSNPERIARNFDVFGFELDADEVARIDALGR